MGKQPKLAACICGNDGVVVKHVDLGDRICAHAWCPTCGLSGPGLVIQNNPVNYNRRVAEATNLWNDFVKEMEE